MYAIIEKLKGYMEKIGEKELTIETKWILW